MALIGDFRNGRIAEMLALICQGEIRFEEIGEEFRVVLGR